MNFNCRLALPYPPVKTQGINLRNAEILMPLYAGMHSETTAVNTYSYQTIATEARDKRMSDIIQCISIVEMKHMHFLGELIHMLGADPKLRSWGTRRGIRWWSGDFVSYETDPQRFLVNNINEEQRAISDYSNAIKNISDPDINALLERIILDEEHHIEIFKQLMK